MGSGLHERVPPASPCPWVDHPVSGRFDATHRPFGLAFAPAPAVPALASPRLTTRRLILQKARRHRVTPCSDRLEAHGFRLSFTPLDGVLFTVPSRYWFPIGRLRYLALGGGPPRFPPDITCPAVLTLRMHRCSNAVTYGALTRSGRPFQQRSVDVGSTRRGVGRPLPCSRSSPMTAAPTSSYAATVWAPPRSLAATQGIVSVPAGTEMFQFPTCPPGIRQVPRIEPRRVAPFGDRWITGCQRLPNAFRRVAASFIGRRRQGIHRAPIIAASHRVPNAPRSRHHPVAHPAMSPSPGGVLSSVTSGGRPRSHPPRGNQAGTRLRHSLVNVPRHAAHRWSRGDSNPGPPPCKGGALPAKLRPLVALGAPVRLRRQILPRVRWARLDSNQGPRPYQGRALTS
jgi:hypothetical protein